jgi:5-methylcytosine-specific restriction endonuclease McrA
MTKEEQRIYNKNYRQKNLKKLRAQSKANAALHKEDKKKYDAERYATNPEKAKIRSGKWGKENPEKKKQANAEWYQENKERITIKARSDYEKDKGKYKARMKAYRETHPEVDQAKHAKRRAEKLGNGGSFTAKEWTNLCRHYGNKCLDCGKKCKLQADHIVPLSKGGTSNIDNIQPLCGPCNNRKHTKTIDFRRPHGKR